MNKNEFCIFIAIELIQFEAYLPEILKMCHHNKTNIRVKALRTLAFISVCPDLHNALIRGDALAIVLEMLGKQPAAGICEAGLVFVNHVCAPQGDENENNNNSNNSEHRPNHNHNRNHQHNNHNNNNNQNNRNENKDYITRFFVEKNRLLVLLRYTSVEDDKISILINAFCALAAILVDRLSFQEFAIDYGLLERSMELQADS